MTSLESKILSISIIIGIITLLIIGLLIYRIYRGVLKKSDRKNIAKITGNWYPKVLKILFGVSMLLTIIYAPFYVFISSIYEIFIPNYLNNLLILSILLLAGLECFLMFTVSDTLIKKTYKKVILSVIVVILFPLSVYRTFNIPDMFKYPTEKDSYIINLPVKGIWIAGHAGGTEIVNYHCAHTSQLYAMDIMKVNDNGRIFTGSGNELTDFYTMNEKIYSPVNGTIVTVVDGLPNAKVSSTTTNPDNPAGNHVVIQFEQDRYIFLAHLNKGSVQVKAGDRIKTGDLIGHAGNSGNTTMPHLHMHIQDRPTIDYSGETGFPYRFRSIQRKRWMNWVTVTNGFLIRNDLFKNPD